MSYQIVTGTEKTLEDKLNGTVVSGAFASSGVAVGGKTVIFSDPAETVTFSGSAGALLTPAQIVSELEAGITGLSVGLREQGSVQQTNPKVTKQVSLALSIDAGFTLDKDGTANALLGLSTTADTTSAGAVDSTRIKGFTPSASLGTYALILSDS